MDFTNPWIALAVVAGVATVSFLVLWVRSVARNACPRCFYPKYRCTCEDE